MNRTEAAQALHDNRIILQVHPDAVPESYELTSRKTWVGTSVSFFDEPWYMRNSFANRGYYDTTRGWLQEDFVLPEDGKHASWQTTPTNYHRFSFKIKCVSYHLIPEPTLEFSSNTSDSEGNAFGHPAQTAVVRPQGKVLDDQPAVANAAEALTQLHHTCPPHRSEWGSEPETDIDLTKERMQSSLELPPLRDQFNHDSVASHLQSQVSPRQQVPLPSLLGKSSPRIHSHSHSHPLLSIQTHVHNQAHSRHHSHQTHSGQLPSLRREHREYHRERDDTHRVTRPRKGSLGAVQSIRRPRHDRYRAREHSHTISGHRPSLSFIDRKTLSLEPPVVADAIAGQDHQDDRESHQDHEVPRAAWVQGKRWEDLIEAATSATEADERLSVRGSERDRSQVICPLLKSSRSSLFYEGRQSNLGQSDLHFRASLQLPHPLASERAINQRDHVVGPPPPETELEPFPTVDANAGPRHAAALDAMPSSTAHNLMPTQSFRIATTAGALSSIAGTSVNGPRGLSSISVTSDPEKFSLSNHNHSTSHMTNFGPATPSHTGRNIIGRASSASANASACVSPIIAQRPLTAYSSFSASPAFHPASGPFRANADVRASGPHRASNPIPYASAPSYATNAAGQHTSAINSPQAKPPGSMVATPSTDIGSAAMANTSLGASSISTPPRADRYGWERANTSSDVPIPESRIDTRPNTSATPNVTSNLQNMRISRISDAGEDDDCMMGDTDVDLRVPQIICAPA
ncbi:hypothetical protein KEM54_004767 [Ascosphaera aggregata]|nr:hypothetical protein KEM54_004767 [Ascosphaera aggregata]